MSDHERGIDFSVLNELQKRTQIFVDIWPTPAFSNRASTDRPLAASYNVSTPSVVARSASIALDLNPKLLEIFSGLLNLRFISRNQQVKTILGATPRQLIADTSRSTGNNRELSLIAGHVDPP